MSAEDQRITVEVAPGVSADRAEQIERIAQHVFAVDMALAEWQEQLVEAMVRGDQIVLMPSRQYGRRRLMDLAASLNAVFPDRVAVVPENGRNRILIGLLEDQVFADLEVLEAPTERERYVEPSEIPDVTEADRARWRRELDSPPPNFENDEGSGMTIEELMGEIDLAVAEYREERDE